MRGCGGVPLGILVATGWLAGVACGEPAGFRCTLADQCAGLPEGRCEPDGSCTFSDPTCPSGRRRAEHAPVAPSECLPPGVDAGSDAPPVFPDGPPVLDGAPADGASPARCVWNERLALSAPVALTSLNTPTDEGEPYVTADGLTIYYTSDVGGDADVFRATRASPVGAWEGPAEVVEVNSAVDDGRFALFPDGLIAVLASDRSGEGSDLFVTQRASPLAPFQVPLPLASVNSGVNDWDPVVSLDQRTLYFASDRPGSAAVDLYAAPILSGTYGDAVLVAGVNSAEIDANPSVSGDHRVLVFSSNRPGAPGGSDLWYAVRDDSQSPFGAPRPIPTVNSEAFDSEVFLSPDGCELYFASDRDAPDQLDLYVARVIE